MWVTFFAHYLLAIHLIYMSDWDWISSHPPHKFGQQKVHTFTAGEPKAPAANGLRASSDSPSNVAQLITPGEPNTPSYNETSVLNISFHTSNEASPMLRGSVLYNRQRKHVENHPWAKSRIAHCIGNGDIVMTETNAVVTLKITWCKLDIIRYHCYHTYLSVSI